MEGEDAVAPDTVVLVEVLLVGMLLVGMLLVALALTADELLMTAAVVDVVASLATATRGPVADRWVMVR